MYSINFQCFKPSRSRVHVALFRYVSNSADIKNRIIAASTAEGEEGEKEREAVNFAFIDARLISSKLHLETAIYQGILAESQGGLRTKTVHSEILYYLNPTHNISEAIRRYGVSGNTTDLLIVRIGSSELDQTSIREKILNVVKGDLVPFSELEEITDWSAIKKYHKLDSEPAIRISQHDLLKEHHVIDNIVTSSVAMKSVMQ